MVTFPLAVPTERSEASSRSPLSGSISELGMTSARGSIRQHPIPMPEVRQCCCGIFPTCLRRRWEGSTGMTQKQNGLDDQTMFERIPCQVCVRLEMEFLHNACSIGTDTFHAQREFFGDVRNAFAMGNQAQDLELTV